MKIKAQLAVETLLIYGIAIFIVLMAVSALFAFGILDFGSILPDKCDVRSEAFTCKDYVIRYANVDGQVQLELQNVLGNNLQVYEIHIEGIDDSEGIIPECGNDYYQNGAGSSKIIPSGDTMVFTLNGCADLENFQGKKVKAQIGINWSRVGSEITRWEYGTLQATVSE